MGSSMKRFLFFSIWIFVAAMFGYNVKNFLLGYREPYIYLSASALNPVVSAGEIINLVYEFDRIRYCEVTLSRFIVRKDSEDVVYRDNVVGGAAPVGLNKRVVNPFKIPDDTAPGKYLFRLTANVQCNEGPHYIPAPEIEFQVIARP